MATVVMVVSNRHDPDPRVQKEAEALVEGGHAVTILAYDREAASETAETVIAGVQMRRLCPRPAPYGGLVAVARGLRAFRRACRAHLLELAPDVVHCHDMDTCGVGRWWQRRGGRFVFDAHDQYWTWLLMPAPRSWWRRLGAGVLERRERGHARAADLVITVSEGRDGAVGFAERYRALGAPVEVIWGAPRTRPDPPPPLPEAWTVGYVGNIRERRMFEWLIAGVEALEADERPGLVVVGGGRSAAEVLAMVEAAGERLGVAVHTGGRYDEEEQSALIARCSVQWAVYPLERGNVDRTMAVKLLESVAHGRPVITNEGTLMAAWVRGEAWGWVVEAGDAAGTAAALRAARQRVGEAGVSLELSPPPLWPEQADRLRSAIASLLD